MPIEFKIGLMTDARPRQSTQYEHVCEALKILGRFNISHEYREAYRTVLCACQELFKLQRKCDQVAAEARRQMDMFASPDSGPERDCRSPSFSALRPVARSHFAPSPRDKTLF